MHIPQKKAVVFYARDFLAQEFSRVGVQLTEFERIYIVVRKDEEDLIQNNDPKGHVFYLKNAKSVQKSDFKVEDVSNAFNNDRFLRFYDSGEVQAILKGVHALIDELSEKFQIVAYMDEPVSGYPNFSFNQSFASQGALCLHFQPSWLPGFMFFSSDCAQRVVPKLNAMSNGVELARHHIQQRKSGLAVPLYVINYGGWWARVKDIGLTAAKGFYRKMFRKTSYYLDRDISAHLFHCKSLLASFKGGYLSKHEASKLKGRYVLFPLHYEPEAVLNYFSPFKRQVEIAEKILDSLPEGYQLIVKEHPSQPGALNLSKWQELVKSKRVIKVAGSDNARFFLGLDVVVVSIGSTLALEAAMAGLPVGVLGSVHFAEMPGISHLNTPDEWIRLIHTKPAEESELVQWYGNFLNQNCFAGNFMKNKTDSQQICDVVRGLLKYESTQS